MGRAVDYNKLDLDTLETLEETGAGFEKTKKSRRFDDGTLAAKAAKKRGSKRVVVEEDEN